MFVNMLKYSISQLLQKHRQKGTNQSYVVVPYTLKAGERLIN
jgi:hypothetical protein